MRYLVLLITLEIDLFRE